MCLLHTKSGVLDGFRDYLKIEKGLAPLTVAAYTTDIGQFTAFLEKHKRTLLNAQRNHVREFIQQLFGNAVDGRSVGRKLSALRHLYRYLLLDKMIEHDPTLNIDSPKQWKVLPKALARDEMESMLAPHAASHNKEAEAIAARDHAMLEVFYAAALRVSEIVGVQLEDLKIDLGCLLVRGKGDKERIVPLGKGAQDALTVYMKDARPILAKGKSSPLLIPGTRRQKADPAASLADGARGLGRCGAQCQPAHAAAQLRHAHGRKWRRPAHGADHPGPRRHFDHAGLHAHGAGSVEDGVSEASSQSEGAVREC